MEEEHKKSREREKEGKRKGRIKHTTHKNGNYVSDRYVN